jgi:hypothetical protein
MLPRSPRPRAADDFATIRARMEELRRERGRAPADDNARISNGPRPYAISGRPEAAKIVGLVADHAPGAAKGEDGLK